MNTETKTNPEAAAVLPVVKIRVVDIVPDPRNQGRNDEAALRGLAATIEKDGLLQPITVRLNENPLDVKYMIVAGERRWRAHRLLEREEIEARVVTSESELRAARLRAVENLERENLNAVQEARQYAELIELGMTQAEAAEMARVDQSTMSNRLRILKLPSGVLKLIEAGQLTRAHGIALLRFEAWPEVMGEIAFLAASLGVGSKRLEKGLPFCGHDEIRDLVVEVWGHNMPAEWRKDPAVFEADPFDDVHSGNFYVLDVKRWKEGEAKRLAARAKAEDAERAARGNTPEAKAAAERVAREAAEAREKSRARREKILVSLSKANAAIRAGKVPAGYLMAKLVESAIAGGYGLATIEQAFAAQGVRPHPSVLPRNGSHGLRDISAMRKMKPDELLRVAVATVLIREANTALKEPRMAVDSIEGMAVYAPPPSKAEKALGQAVKAAQAVGENRSGKTAAAAKIVKQAKAKVGKVVSHSARKVKREKPTKITDEIRVVVKQLVETGRTNAEIAERVCISESSVQTIKKALGYVKHRAESRRQAPATAGKEAA